MLFLIPCRWCPDPPMRIFGPPHRPAGPRGTSGRDDCGRSRTKQRHSSDRTPRYGFVHRRGCVPAEEAVAMDITTVNDRHLYQGRVVVEDPADPSRAIDLPGRIVPFGPAGWLTVMA